MADSDDLRGPRRRTVLAVAGAVMLVVAGLAGCVAPSPGPDGRPGVDAAAVVPGEADVVVHVSPGGMADDPALTAFEQYNLSESTDETERPPRPESPLTNRSTLESLANSSRVDWDALESLTLFARYPQPGDADDGPGLAVAEEDAETDDTASPFAAAVIAADWTTADLVATVENASRTATDAAAREQTSVAGVEGADPDDPLPTAPGDGAEDAVPQQPVDLVADSYRGHTVYRPGNESRGGAVGVVREGVFVIGSEAAVEATIDVERGERAAMNGTLATVYGATPEDAYVRFGARVPSDRVPDAPPAAGGFNTAVFTNVTGLGGGYATDGDEVVLQGALSFTDVDTAAAAADVVDGARTTYRGLADNETVKTALADEHLSIAQDGTVVRFRSHGDAGFWVDVLRWMGSTEQAEEVRQARSEPVESARIDAPANGGVFTSTAGTLR